MHMFVVGLNHQTAPVEVREKFSLSEDDLPSALRQLNQRHGVQQCVIVGTCNRMEIYVMTDQLQRCAHAVYEFMEQTFKVSRKLFLQYVYEYSEDEAFEHLLRVTTGLNSMIVGETQIIGQVRHAFLLAQRLGMTGTELNTLFKQAITFAKKAHTDTAISEQAVSISYAAVELAKRRFGSLAGKRALLIGAGKMGELTLKYLLDNGVQDIVIANRSEQRGAELAEQVKGTYCTLEDIVAQVAKVDIIISSTGSARYVLTKEQVALALQNARQLNKPLLFIDIAVPRDLDPRIAELSENMLYDIDDLEGIVEHNVEQRQQEAQKVEQMIAKEVVAMRLWLDTKHVGPMISALQQKSQFIHEKTMTSLLNRLPQLDERERKIIYMLTKSMMNQLLQSPIASIKELAQQGDVDDVLQVFTKLFALDEDNKQAKEQDISSSETNIARSEAAVSIEMSRHRLTI